MVFPPFPNFPAQSAFYFFNFKYKSKSPSPNPFSPLSSFLFFSPPYRNIGKIQHGLIFQRLLERSHKPGSFTLPRVFSRSPLPPGLYPLSNEMPIFPPPLSGCTRDSVKKPPWFFHSSPHSFVPLPSYSSSISPPSPELGFPGHPAFFSSQYYSDFPNELLFYRHVPLLNFFIGLTSPQAHPTPLIFAPRHHLSKFSSLLPHLSSFLFATSFQNVICTSLSPAVIPERYLQNSWVVPSFQLFIPPGKSTPCFP